MNLPLRVGYEGAALLARALASVAPAAGGKLLRSFAARRGVRARFRSFTPDTLQTFLRSALP